MCTCSPNSPCAECVVAALQQTNPVLRKKFRLPAPPATTIRTNRVSLPVCTYRGEGLTGLEREAAGLSHGRLWFHCEHPTTPLGPHVCPCRGCGAGCGGYTDVAPPRWIPVTDTPAPPTNPRLVVTLVVGPDAEEMHDLTGPGQRRYADRIGADYVVIRGKTQDERMPCAEKWRVGTWVSLYPEGTVYLDADVYVTPDAPDILAATPVGSVGMVDVLPRTPGLAPWFETRLADVCKSQGVETPMCLLPHYYNSGVWVGRPAEAAYWNPCPHPYPVDWCVEEIWCRVNAHRLGIPIHTLDSRFNWTWIEDRDLRHAAADPPWLWHFAGMGNPQANSVEAWKQPNRVWRLAMLRLLAAQEKR